MLKKLGRAVLTIIGAGIGFGLCKLVLYVLRATGASLGTAFTSVQQTGIAVAFAIIFAIIFFKMTPVFAKQSERFAGSVERELNNISGSRLIGGTVGLIAGLFIAFLLMQMFTFIRNSYFYAVIVIILYLGFGYMGVVVGSRKKIEFPNLLALRQQDPAKGRDKKKADGVPKILDTSVIIDGRIADIMSTGFLEGPIVIPEFVLVELRHIADSSDSLKRTRGRRGLDILKKIQSDYSVEIYNTENEKSLREIPEVDVKLLKLAQIMNGKVVTNDYNLNKVAAINGVGVLNINKLANCLKPVVLPGEEMTVHLVKQGKDANQGIGYLDDGTMIVAEDGRRMIGQTIRLTVTSVLQTSAGRMIFGRLKTG